MIQKINSFIRKLNKTQKSILIIVAIILIGLALFLFYQYLSGEEIENSQVEQTQENVQTESNKKQEQNQDKNKTENEMEDYNTQDDLNDGSTSSLFGTKQLGNIVIHVIGEVKKPGVIKLKEGSRIIDAINKCGGQTEDADLSKINLAYVLDDGSQVYIPRIKEDIQNTTIMKTEAGNNVIVNNVTQTNDGKDPKVNLNTATLEKLITLPGVGESTAQKIIEYRNKNKKFKSIDELKNVAGIGEAKFNALKDFIYVK
jgi:competence protein ComEA